MKKCNYVLLNNIIIYSELLGWWKHSFLFRLENLHWMSSDFNNALFCLFLCWSYFNCSNVESVSWPLVWHSSIVFPVLWWLSRSSPAWPAPKPASEEIPSWWYSYVPFRVSPSRAKTSWPPCGGGVRDSTTTPSKRWLGLSWARVCVQMDELHMQEGLSRLTVICVLQCEEHLQALPFNSF